MEGQVQKQRYMLVDEYVSGQRFWKVLEIETDQCVVSSVDYKDMAKLTKFMNRGGAFNGWTPAFMIRSVKVLSGDVNENFSRAFADIGS